MKLAYERIVFRLFVKWLWYNNKSLHSQLHYERNFDFSNVQKNTREQTENFIKSRPGNRENHAIEVTFRFIPISQSVVEI